MARFLCAAFAAVVAATPVKVLPLGDSITFGCGDGCNGLGCGDQCAVSRPSCQAGWRAGLWRRLSQSGNSSEAWDFVGTQENGPEDIDRQHEGHPAWKIEQIRGISEKWLPTQPDVILLHLGTNNLGIGLQSPATALGHMSDLLDTIFEALPKVRVLLSTLIGSGKDYAGLKHAEYNEGLKTMVQAQQQNERHVTLVDMATESGIGEFCDSKNCCFAGIHPNAQGYDLMADVWHAHLTAMPMTLV
jgi:lysophospholipase L1-like esterase